MDGGQHLDRHAPPHELVLAQVDAAHAAGAEAFEDLVFADGEALPLALEDLLGLEIGQHAVPDQERCQRGGFGGHGPEARKLVQVGGQSLVLDHAAFLDKVQKFSDVAWRRHRSTYQGLMMEPSASRSGPPHAPCTNSPGLPVCQPGARTCKWHRLCRALARIVSRHKAEQPKRRSQRTIHFRLYSLERIRVSMDRQTVRAVCPHDCPDTCSMVVTVANGKAIDLRGDPDHPFTAGFLCGKVTRYLERVYHPERLLHPLRRIGPKRLPRRSPHSSASAGTRRCDTIARKFQDIAASADGPQAILPYSYAGTMGKLQGGSLDRRFFHRLGASLLDRTICAAAGMAGCDVTLGTRAAIDPETVVHCPLHHQLGLQHQRHQHAPVGPDAPGPQARGQDRHHRSATAVATAERSDWWLPIRPGTDAALALGMMHILWRDGLQDDDYLERYCLGGPQLRERALDEYPPEQGRRHLRLAEADIERLAHEYGTVRPSLIRLNYGMQRHGGGGMAVRTITCLPAIIGAWRDVGGGASLSTSSALSLRQTAAARTARPDSARHAHHQHGPAGRGPGRRTAPPAGAGPVRLQRQPRRGLSGPGPRARRACSARTCSPSSTINS